MVNGGDPVEKKSKIFQPIQIGPVLVKNRIEVAPAAPFLANHDGSVSQELYKYTMNLARSGAGIVTIGVSGVDPREPFGGRILSASSPLYLSGLCDLAEGIKSFGTAASIELVHSRYMLTSPEIVVGKTSTEEVEEIIKDFADAAQLCMTAGFDMIMIHGGHGNVPSMFFNKKFNKRADRFGGSFEGRCRFGVELLKAIRESTGHKIAVEYRISAEEMLADMTTLEETLEYAKVIQDHIDLLHVSRGLLEVDELLPYINAPVYLPRALNLPYAKKFKEALRVPVSVVGSFDLDIAEKAVREGDADMVSMIRTILADTDCVEKARRGRDELIRPCIRCNVCISRTHSQFKTVRCSVNPLVGRETRFETGKADAVKKVVVIGGGPAGLEAARVASARGHSVVLFERQEELGGLFKMACAAEFKQDMKAYLDWSISTVRNDPGIDLRLGTEATREQVENENPDAVLIAVGADPITPKFTATGTPKLLWVGDVEQNAAAVGDNVVIAGAGITGMELALSLSRMGKKIKIVDMLPESAIGQGGAPISMICLKALLARENVTFQCGVRIEDVTQDGALISSSDRQQELLPCDTVILSLGFRPNKALIEEFSGMADDIFVIGDCAGAGGTVWNATRTAFDKAMQI